jgi:hypothetical protein
MAYQDPYSDAASRRYSMDDEGYFADRQTGGVTNRFSSYGGVNRLPQGRESYFDPTTARAMGAGFAGGDPLSDAVSRRFVQQPAERMGYETLDRLTGATGGRGGWYPTPYMTQQVRDRFPIFKQTPDWDADLGADLGADFDSIFRAYVDMVNGGRSGGFAEGERGRDWTWGRGELYEQPGAWREYYPRR